MDLIYRINKPILGDLESKLLQEVVELDWIGVEGTYTKLFERDFSKYHGCKYGYAVQSGTAALHTAFWCLLKDKSFNKSLYVAVPDYTCASNAAAVCMANAVPVLVDVELDTFGMDFSLLEEAHKKYTLSIVCLVHVYGTPARDTIIIREFCKSNDILLVEDCSQAHGANIGMQRVGSFGDIAVFSLRSDKIVSAGEGGICITNSEHYYDIMKYFGNRCKPYKGWWNKYYTDNVGMNYSMPHLSGAMAFSQFQKLPYMLLRRREIALLYRDYLSEFLFNNFIEGSSCWLNYIRFPMKEEFYKFVMNMGKLLVDNGVEVRPGFYPLHRQEVFKKCPTVTSSIRGNWNSINIGFSGLCVPSHTGLSNKDIEDISNLILNFWYDINENSRN